MIYENLPSTNTPINATNLNATINLTGFIQMFAGSTAPTGWLICDGSAVSRTTYADLYAVIGTTYGTGDGSTTFNLPNLKGKVVVGQDSNDTDFDTLGETGGEKKHTLITSELPSHSHPYLGYKTSGLSFNGSAQYFGTAYATNASVVSVGGNTSTAGSNVAHNILQPYIVMNYIIKT